ncbi:hypothetical protein GN956_G24582 [Arapaima gigas]
MHMDAGTIHPASSTLSKTKRTLRRLYTRTQVREGLAPQCLGLVLVSLCQDGLGLIDCPRMPLFSFSRFVLTERSGDLPPSFCLFTLRQKCQQG